MIETTEQKGCNNCGEECILINSDCLCKFTPIKGVKIKNIMDCVIEANEVIIDCIGEECFKDICNEVNPEDENHIANLVKNNRQFKRLYSKIIYLHWLCNYGAGSSKAEGVIVKLGDEISNYRNAKPIELRAKIEKLECSIKSIKEKFVKWMQENTDCIECEEKKGCGCVSDCECKAPYGCDNSCACGRFDVCGCGTKNTPIVNSWAAIS